MFQGLMQHPTLLAYRKQYEMLPTRDRLALKVLALAVGLIVLYFAAWQPAFEYKKNAEINLVEKQKLLALVENNRNVLTKLNAKSGANGAKANLDSQQLVSAVTNLAKQKGVVLKRFEPSGERKLKVWVDDASFDKVMIWLSALRKKLNVKVEQISVEKDDAVGQISARLTLST